MMKLTVLLRSVMYRTVITDRHPTMLVWLLFCIHWSWALGISKALVFDRSQISYGQVLSLFAPLPGLWSVLKILFDHRANIKDFIVNIPAFVCQGVCFIVTGRNEWFTTPEILDHDYLHWPRRRWLFSGYPCPSYQVALFLSCACPS